MEKRNIPSIFVRFKKGNILIMHWSLTLCLFSWFKKSYIQVQTTLELVYFKSSEVIQNCV